MEKMFFVSLTFASLNMSMYLKKFKKKKVEKNISRPQQNRVKVPKNLF